MLFMLLKISVTLIWIIYLSFAKLAPELATPAKKCAPELNPGAPDFMRIVIVTKMGT